MLTPLLSHSSLCQHLAPSCGSSQDSFGDRWLICLRLPLCDRSPSFEGVFGESLIVENVSCDVTLGAEYWVHFRSGAMTATRARIKPFFIVSSGRAGTHIASRLS